MGIEWELLVSVDEAFASLDSAAIKRWLEEARQEDLHLEFKQVGDPSMTREDRKNYARAVSGFANAEGGIIVWGVDCRKNDDNIDVVNSLPGVSEVARFFSSLEEYSASCTSPGVVGLRHRLIKAGDNLNFVATLVPQSESPPHMAKLGEDRYYQRIGGSFLKMEHFQIADLFGRRRKPQLGVELQLRGERLDDRSGLQHALYRAIVVVYLRNHGRGIAFHTYFQARLPEGWSVSRYDELFRWVGKEKLVCYARPGTVIHPDTAVPVAEVAIEFGTIRSSGVRTRWEVPDLEVHYSLVAQDCPLFDGHESMSSDAITSQTIADTRHD